MKRHLRIVSRSGGLLCYRLCDDRFARCPRREQNKKRKYSMKVHGGRVIAPMCNIERDPLARFRANYIYSIPRIPAVLIRVRGANLGLLLFEMLEIRFLLILNVNGGRARYLSVIFVLIVVFIVFRSDLTLFVMTCSAK